MQEKIDIGLVISIILLAYGLLTLSPVRAQSREDILEFYWNRAARTYEQNAPLDSLSYRLRAFTYLKNLNKRGEIQNLDSATVDFYFTGRTLDSQKVVSGDGSGKFEQVELTMPDIFQYPYLLSRYPNDDGRGPLAIGLDTDTSGLAQPTGLLLIDRENYQPLRVYLHWANDPSYVRLSRSYQFAQQNGLLLPDSVWVNASTRGILYPERYRLETDITDIEVYP